MEPTPSAIGDSDRLAALYATELLDSPPEQPFDQLACTAARLLEAPIALIALVDDHRQFFKSCIGNLPEPWRSIRGTSLYHSICKYAVGSGEPLVIADAREHQLTRNSLATQDLGVVAYLGVPLITPEDHAIGTLSVIDSKPREWDRGHIKTLEGLAADVMSLIAYRSTAQTAPRSQLRSDRGGRRATSSSDDSNDIINATKILADIISEYLSQLSRFDTLIQNSAAGAGLFDSEDETRHRIFDTEEILRDHMRYFQQIHKADRQKLDSNQIQSAVELWFACKNYSDAKQCRSEAVLKFQELKGSLADVQREAVLTMQMEQALRTAFSEYQHSSSNVVYLRD